MRRYDDLISVQRGPMSSLAAHQGATPPPAEAADEGPAHFVWRDRVWRVCAVVAHWVETGAWWEHPDLLALLGTGSEPTDDGAGSSVAALLGEREVWRVDAERGRGGRRGVFDLSFDWSTGEWRLTRCMD
ncbi:MAG: DUF6504 family protein [Nocardioidaceae bacterium]